MMFNSAWAHEGSRYRARANSKHLNLGVEAFKLQEGVIIEASKPF